MKNIRDNSELTRIFFTHGSPPVSQVKRCGQAEAGFEDSSVPKRGAGSPNTSENKRKNTDKSQYFFFAQHRGRR